MAPTFDVALPVVGLHLVDLAGQIRESVHADVALRGHKADLAELLAVKGRHVVARHRDPGVLQHVLSYDVRLVRSGGYVEIRMLPCKYSLLAYR